MENKERSIRDWLKAFDAGQFDAKDRDTQIEAGWYDWFCSDKSLANKTKKLAPKVRAIAGSLKVNQDTSYVFFKNNCPVYGKLYDDFRICDMTNGGVIFTIVPVSGHKSMEGKGEVWGKVNEFKEALIVGSWKEIRDWFGV